MNHRRRAPVRHLFLAVGLCTGAVALTSPVPASASVTPLAEQRSLLSAGVDGRVIVLAEARPTTVGSFDVYRDAKQIDRITGQSRTLPPLITVSADGSALITEDLQWLDIATGERRPVPGTEGLTTIVLSGDGRSILVGGDTTDRSAVIDATTGRVQPFPVTGSPRVARPIQNQLGHGGISGEGRYVLIDRSCPPVGSGSGCARTDRWDRLTGRVERVALNIGTLTEYASDIADDGSVPVTIRPTENTVRYEIRRPGRPAAAVPVPFPTPAKSLDAITPDGRFVFVLFCAGSLGCGPTALDLVTGREVTINLTFSIYPGGGLRTRTWAITRDGSAVVSIGVSSGFGPSQPDPILLFVEVLGQETGHIGPLEELRVAVAGANGVPADATAVNINATITDARADGFVTIWPCGQPRPLASNTNVSAGQTVAAAAIVGVGDGGSICVTANTAVNVIIDVQGWFGAGSHYTARVPTRVIDTRERPAVTAELVSTEGLQIDVAASGVPADARAVAVNITVTNTTADGFAVVWPCGQPTNTSTVNFLAGQTAANLAITGRSSNGSICVRTNVAADIIVDVQGWFEMASNYRPAAPNRLVVAQTTQAGTIFRVPIPAAVAPPGSAVMLNLTMTDVAVGGWALVWPCDATVPLASNVNAAAWHTVANAVLAAISGDGEVCMTTNAATKLILDSSGGFTAAGDYHPLIPIRILDTRDA